jgi:hypothetical protein
MIWLGVTAPTQSEAGPIRPLGDDVSGGVKAAEAAQATPAHPGNWIETLPRPKGSARDGFLRYPSHAREVEGGIAHLVGAVRIYDISKSVYRRGADSMLELSVESGKVRAYLEYFPDTGSFFRHQDGYIFAEAVPGTPAKVEGFLSFSGGSGSNETYAVTFESLDGEATGIRYKIVPRR